MDATIANEPVKGLYQHFKGGFFEVLGIAEEPESGKRRIVYRAIGLMENLLEPDPDDAPHLQSRVVDTPNHGELAVCSIQRFTELVGGGAYHEGERVPRFRLFSRALRG